MKKTIFTTIILIAFYSTGNASDSNLKSTQPLDDWNCPTSHPVKGNINTTKKTMIYHIPKGSFYKRTKPEECFTSEEEAQAAGYRRSMR